MLLIITFWSLIECAIFRFIGLITLFYFNSHLFFDYSHLIIYWNYFSIHLAFFLSFIINFGAFLIYFMSYSIHLLCYAILHLIFRVLDLKCLFCSNIMPFFLSLKMNLLNVYWVVKFPYLFDGFFVISYLIIML